MTPKQSSPDNDIEYALYCDSLEKQYQKTKEQGLFEVLRVVELDKEHSDTNLVQAIDYFNEKGGVIEKENDVPMDFLTEREKSLVNQDGKFRHALYCMLLSTKFAQAIENKSAFLQHSYKYRFDREGENSRISE